MLAFFQSVGKLRKAFVPSHSQPEVSLVRLALLGRDNPSSCSLSIKTVKSLAIFDANLSLFLFAPRRFRSVPSMSVVFRDPRDVVLSSHRYRTETVVVGYQHVEHDLFAFIDHYFEVGVERRLLK